MNSTIYLLREGRLICVLDTDGDTRFNCLVNDGNDRHIVDSILVLLLVIIMTRNGILFVLVIESNGDAGWSTI